MSSHAGDAEPADLAIRILVADDNAGVRTSLTRLLGKRWIVETVADGRAALAAIRARRPTLVISDVEMPHLDGFGLLRAIKSDPLARMVKSADQS